MTTGRFRQTGLDSLLEQLKVLVIFRIQALFFDEFPQTLNQIEIGGVGRQKEDFDAQISSLLKHQPTALIASIIHHHSHRQSQPEQSYLLQQCTDTGRRDVAVVGHGDKLMRDGIQGTQDVEALPSAGRTHQDACETPEIAQIRPQHKVGTIHKKDGSRSGFGLL